MQAWIQKHLNYDSGIDLEPRVVVLMGGESLLKRLDHPFSEASNGSSEPVKIFV